MTKTAYKKPRSKSNSKTRAAKRRAQAKAKAVVRTAARPETQAPAQTLAAVQKPMVINFEMFGLNLGPVLHYANYTLREQVAIQRMMESVPKGFAFQKLMKSIRLQLYWLAEVRAMTLEIPECIYSSSNPKQKRRQDANTRKDIALFGSAACAQLARDLDELRDRLADKGPSLLPHNVQALMRKHLPHVV